MGTMLGSLHSRQDLLKTFVPLSDSGKAYLEVALVNPKTSMAEGRGFFNDADFLLDACAPHVGRYNFCLSNFAYAPEQVPTRASCNQFDRTFLDDSLQQGARAHSLSAIFFFKPDLIREMQERRGGGDQFLDIVYQVDAILGRLGIKTYGMDYFLTGMVARFLPYGALQSRPMGRAALAQASRRLVEAIEKQMQQQELKRFAIGSAAEGKAWDPLPGLPGQFSGEGQDTVIVASSGALQPCEDAPFAAVLDEAGDGKISRLQADRPADAVNAYASSLQGLSQNWVEGPFDPDPGMGMHKDFADRKPGDATPKPDMGGMGGMGSLGAREGASGLAAHLQACSQGRWRWPLFSGHFNKAHQGSASGEMLLLQAEPFASDLAFNYLMQCAEAFAKEGAGQLAVFSKRRTAGDIALGSLRRHYKADPLDARQAGRFPDPEGLAKVHRSLFPGTPHVPACGRDEDLDNVLRYLEHDYLLKQRKTGSPLTPLAIIVDEIGDFQQEGAQETCKRLAALKQRLREVNGTLWITQSRPAGSPAPREYAGLADHIATLDHDGSLESADTGSKPPRPGEWEAGFHLDLSLGKLMHEISLVKIRYQAHGSHRVLHGHYVYYRPSLLFREIHPPAQGRGGEARGQAPQPAAANGKAHAASPAGGPAGGPAAETALPARGPASR